MSTEWHKAVMAIETPCSGDKRRTGAIHQGHIPRLWRSSLGVLKAREVTPKALPRATADVNVTFHFQLWALNISSAPLSAPFPDILWSYFLTVSCLFYFEQCNRLVERWDGP